MSEFKMNNGNLLVGVDGNIGAGKSTLLENIKLKYKNDPNVIILGEPLDIWDTIRDETGTTMLSKFYTDPKTYAFPFQIMALHSRYSILKKAMTENKNKIIISERTLFTDKHVFAEMLYKQGSISYINFQVYLQCFDELCKDYPVENIIYVKATPEVCQERIQKRARTGEETIPLEYLQDCHAHHEEYLLHHQKIVFDGNNDIYKNATLLEQWLNRIDEIVCEHKNKNK
jgi:deoxyadenosine/deoxycytidine kinase